MVPTQKCYLAIPIGVVRSGAFAAATRREGLRRTLRSCRSWCASEQTVRQSSVLVRQNSAALVADLFSPALLPLALTQLAQCSHAQYRSYSSASCRSLSRRAATFSHALAISSKVTLSSGRVIRTAKARQCSAFCLYSSTRRTVREAILCGPTPSMRFASAHFGAPERGRCRW